VTLAASVTILYGPGECRLFLLPAGEKVAQRIEQKPLAELPLLLRIVSGRN
jgi:hypothetical protein